MLVYPIHSIWFGPKEPSQLAMQCIATWPEHDQVTIWSRAMLSSVVPWLYEIPYFNDAYRAGHWAGASDVARLALLYELGGVYLDTDVEIVNQSHLDELYKVAVADNGAVFGFEDETFICAAVTVAAKGAPFIKGLLDMYRRTPFSSTFGDTPFNGTTLLTQAVRSHQAAGLTILPQHMFYPWTPQERGLSDVEKDERKKQAGVVCAHFWEASWVK